VNVLLVLLIVTLLASAVAGLIFLGACRDRDLLVLTLLIAGLLVSVFICLTVTDLTANQLVESAGLAVLCLSHLLAETFANAS
jgi:hypothetical protein